LTLCASVSLTVADGLWGFLSVVITCRL
jgi:hypothetical protein